ncbi:peptidase S41 [Candidatus Epulonipiscium fishelsonii]|uniref:Peptidase S41 n=1 Tax=Candidatus Epulonipiscium fishelsonii TaxID=77094 RepID=A0ACC8X8S6_9FIRM|nr:peptidase S41 [Epulopiscium sp. SCG-D08WGA-EpuloA1]
MARKTFWTSTGVGFALSLAIGFIGTAFINAENGVEINEKMDAIEQILEESYVGEINPQKMEEGIYKGFVSGVGDPYTSYFTPEEFEDFMSQTRGIYVGIGVQMTIDKTDNNITIVEVFPDSPAEKAGILPKDKIIGAAGSPLTGDDFDLAPELITGEEGTSVVVKIYRPSTDETINFLVERARVVYPSVDYEMMDNQIGYIHLRQFEELTHEQFNEALNDLEKQGAKGIVLDLRNNTGGFLDVTENIVDELIPQGIIVSTKDNSGEIVHSESDDKYTDIPLVVLVNEQSASASEVLSGALKDHNRAKLVGTRTFGKGIVQSIMPFIDGSAIKITTAEYYTPSGISIQGIGIEPDYLVELPVELMIEPDLTLEQDLQLQKAIEVLSME